MNACTMLALRDAASDDDVHLLQRMLDDRDRVAALTALCVLATMGDAGVAAVKTRRSPTTMSDAESAIRDAARPGPGCADGSAAPAGLAPVRR